MSGNSLTYFVVKHWYPVFSSFLYRKSLCVCVCPSVMQTSSSGSRSEDTWSGMMTRLERGGVFSEVSCLSRVEK